MKKVFAAITILMVLLSVMSGCGKKVKCDFCADEKKCEAIEILGDELNICKECKKELAEMFE